MCSSGLGRPNYNWPTHVAPSVSQPKTLLPTLTSQTSAKAKNDRKPNVKNPSLVEGQADHQVHDQVGEWPGPDHHQTDVKVYAQYTQVTAHHHHHVAQLEEALIRWLRLTHKCAWCWEKHPWKLFQNHCQNWEDRQQHRSTPSTIQLIKSRAALKWQSFKTNKFNMLMIKCPDYISFNPDGEWSHAPH